MFKNDVENWIAFRKIISNFWRYTDKFWWFKKQFSLINLIIPHTIRSTKNSISSSTPGIRWKKMIVFCGSKHLLVYRVVYIYNFPFVKELFLCTLYKNHKLTNITFVISMLPVFEVMVPATFEENRILLYQNRAMIKDSFVFWEKRGFRQRELFASWLLFCEYNCLLNWQILNHKWWKQWYNRTANKILWHSI